MPPNALRKGLFNMNDHAHAVGTDAQDGRPCSGLMGMLPGMGGMAQNQLEAAGLNDKMFAEAADRADQFHERRRSARNPEPSARPAASKRIAAGAGMDVEPTSTSF